MTAHLMSTPRTGVYVPWRERRVTERAFFVGPEKTHRSILLQTKTRLKWGCANTRLSYSDISTP